MTGLLIKDLYTLLKQMGIFVVFIVIYALLTGENGTPIGTVFGAMLPITALAYDEQSKWDRLAAMMPYSTRTIVLEKYVLGYLLTLAGAGISALGRLIVPDAAFDLTYAVTFFGVVLVALLMLAVNLPLMLQIGVERGRILFLILTVGAITLGNLFSENLTQLLSDITLPFPALAACVVGAVVVVNLLSMFCAVKLYCRRRR